MGMKKLGVVITDGVGFRNFVMSNFIKEAHQKFEKVTIYSGLPETIYGSLPENVEVKELKVFTEGKASWYFRKWKEITHLQRGRSYYGMKDNKKMNYPNTTRKGFMIKVIYFVTFFHSSNRLISLAERLQFWSFSKNEITKSYIRMLKEDAPDHLFFTHQRPSYLAPLLYAAIQLKIPASSFIFSWDNLASKGRMLGTFDYFFVWSHLMKEELLTFYPKTKPENVKVVGTPQFEPYVMPGYASDKADFYSKFKLDPAKKTICYSCADATIGPNDPLVIRTIAQAIRDNKIGFPVELLVRTSPAEDPKRFEPVKEEFPEIIWNNPKWILSRENHAEAWSQRVPSHEDIKDLRAVLEFSDLSINMCSTMSLDFMIFDKPVVNTVFGNPQNGLYNDQRFLKYVHYKKVVDSGAVVVAKTREELIDAINDALANPKERSQQRKGMIDLQISEPLLNTSARIANILSQLYD